MKLTIKEIANLAGVSVTTVSQILNNKGSRFSEQTTKKVLAVVKEYDYKPDYFASNIITRHSKTIGMIVPDVTDFFFSKVIEGVETYLNSLGYMILLCNSKHDEAQAMKYREELIHRAVDGIIFATPNILPTDSLVQDTHKRRVPMILIDRGINAREQGQLLVKEYEGAYEAVSFLIAQGHRHIAMLKEKEGYYKLTDRVAAYQDALKDHGLLVRKEYFSSGDLNLAGGYSAAAKVLAHSEITAIFCGNDEMAMGAYQAVEAVGKKIPEDISIIGFDGLEISEYLVPGLTTVYQPSFDIGFYAAKFLVEAIHHPETKLPNKIFETTFIMRNSTKSIDNIAKLI